MNNKKCISIPIDLLISKKTINSDIPLKKVFINHKYNFLDDEYNLVSNIWFNKIEGDFTDSDEVTVSKNGSKFNVLTKNKNFVFDNWYYYIKRITDFKNNKKAYIVYKERYLCNIFIEGKGFISDEWFTDCELIFGSKCMFKLGNFNNKPFKTKLFNAKTNKLYDDSYDYIYNLENTIIALKYEEPSLVKYFITDKNGNEIKDEKTILNIIKKFK